MGRKAALPEIIKCCEHRFNRGAASGWKHSDFSDLSFEIRQVTKVLISPNTLKRIFGKITVEDDYQPQQATLDALKEYGGYVPQLSEQPADVPVLPRAVPVEVKRSGFSRIWLLALLAVISIGISVFFIIRNSQKGPSGNIRLSGTEGLLPATAYFQVALNDSKDSVFVNFGDKSPLLPVKPGERTIAHNYLFPGVFNVTLQAKQSSLASTVVSVRSDGWVALGFHNQRELPKRYYEFPAVKTGPDSLFHLSEGQLSAVGLDTTILFYTRLCNFTPVSVKSNPDNFIFEMVFKNRVDEKGIYCNTSQFQVAGINGFIRFKLASPGCSYKVLNVVSEQAFDGAKSNLSQFAQNLQEWNTVKLINQDKKVSLFVNDKLIFSGPYQRSIGDIQGMFIEFEGTGYVKSCVLKNPDGSILYRF
ncbi:MAG: PKD domain-containing protein [Chitinophagaceae bacterium]